ncbi:hypothetical protein Tco_0428685 [Tanacetum coccineum]
MIIMTSMIELGSLFGPLFDEYFNGENQVVSKSFDVTTADASNKRQQQPNSTSSTSTLAITLDEEEEIRSFQDKYEKAQVDQESQIKMIHDKEMMPDYRSQKLKVKRRRLKIKIAKHEGTKPLQTRKDEDKTEEA